MDLSTTADLIATAAIVVSLCFVAYEINQTRKQTALTNWRELLDTLVGFKGLTNDLAFADLVRRGHADYHGLTETEKLAFGLYLEQGIHVLGNFAKHNDALPTKIKDIEIPLTNMFYDLLGTPGGAAWWEESKTKGRFFPDTYVITEGFLQPRRDRGGAPLLKD